MQNGNWRPTHPNGSPAQPQEQHVFWPQQQQPQAAFQQDYAAQASAAAPLYVGQQQQAAFAEQRQQYLAYQQQLHEQQQLREQQQQQQLQQQQQQQLDQQQEQQLKQQQEQQQQQFGQAPFYTPNQYANYLQQQENELPSSRFHLNAAAGGVAPTSIMAPLRRSTGMKSVHFYLPSDGAHSNFASGNSNSKF